MLTLLTIVVSIALCFLVGAVCHLVVLTAVIRRDGWRSVLAGLVPPYLFYRGWKQAEALRVARWMKLWTGATTIIVLLGAFLQVQMG